MQREFPGLRLDLLRAHPGLGVIAALGSRTCMLLSPALDVVQRHLDADRKEEFYCCEFADVADGDRGVRHLLLVAGESGIVKVLDLQRGRAAGYLRGHTGAVYDIKAAGGVVVSCSEDSTLRLWDLRSYSCVAVLGGLAGHRDRVLSIALHHGGRRVVSAGTDTTIRQWAVDLDALSSRAPAGPALVHRPVQSFTGVHRSAITKVAYYGDIILALCNNRVAAVYSNADLDKLGRLDAEGLGTRFLPDNPVFLGAVDFRGGCKTFTVAGHVLLGLGTAGDIYLYDLRSLSAETAPRRMEARLAHAEDIVLVGGSVYVTTGSAVHRIPLDAHPE